MYDKTDEERKRYFATENGREAKARYQRRYRAKTKSITIYFGEDEIEIYDEIDRVKGKMSFSEFGLVALKSVL